MPDKIIYEEFGGTAASESYVDDGWGLVRLVSTGMNKRRVDAGAMRYHVDHDWTKPVGIIDDLRYDGAGNYDYRGRIPVKRYNEEIEEYIEVQFNKDFREQREAGVRGSNSIGFRINDLRFVAAGATMYEDKFDATDWEPFEISDVTVPADIMAMEKSEFARAAGFSKENDVIIRFGGGLGIINRAVLAKADAQRNAAREAVAEGSMTTKNSIRDVIESFRNGEMRDAEEFIDAMEEQLDMVEDAAYEAREMDDDEEEREGDHEDGMDDDEEREVAERQEERSTTPKVRAEKRRERKMETKNSKRSERYGSHNLNPNPSLSMERDGREGLSVRNLFMLQHAGRRNAPKAFSREAEWLDEYAANREFGSSRLEPFDKSYDFIIPFDFLDMYATRGEGCDPKVYNRDGVRRLTVERVTGQGNDSGGGAMDSLVDATNSMAWLYDTAPILEYFVVDPGRNSRVVEYYGSNTAKPTPSWPGDGGNFTDRSPALVRSELSPVPVGVTYSLSSGLLKGSSIQLANMFQAGAEYLLENELVKGVLSGKNVGNNGANVDEAFVGLMNAGIQSTGYGANDAAFTRADVVATNDRLVTKLAGGENEVYIMSPGIATLANNTLRGGAASNLYVFERDSLRTGTMEGVRAIVSTLLQKASVVNPMVHIFGSRVVVPIWGNGVEVRVFSPPGKDTVEYGLQMHANSAVINPNNGDIIRQGA